MNLNPMFSRTLALVAPVSALTLTHAGAAAVDYFLKIDGIKGESVDDKHKDEIDILSFSWGLTNTPAAGGGAGKATFKEFTVTKKTDVSSPKMMLACATGQPIPSVKFVVRRNPEPGTPEAPQEFYFITLENVLVSSYSSSGSPAGELPTESLSLNFTKITYEYRPQRDDGTGPVVVTFDNGNR
jgi:type VI secretion system secreted protein Hcp